MGREELKENPGGAQEREGKGEGFSHRTLLNEFMYFGLVSDGRS